MSDFASAVNGWKQAASILADTNKALEWALKTIDTLGAIIPQNEGQAARYNEARTARRTAQLYIDAMSKPKVAAK